MPDNGATGRHATGSQSVRDARERHRGVVVVARGSSRIPASRDDGREEVTWKAGRRASAPAGSGGGRREIRCP